MLPEQGTIDDLVERLARFVDAHRPGWSARIRGASEAEIAALERGFRFPESYRRTLAAFGQDDDGLYAKLEHTYGHKRSVSELSEYYADLPVNGGGDLDPQWPPILVGDCYDHLAFDLTSGEPEPPVISEDGKRFAASWENLLFQQTVAVVDTRFSACRSLSQMRPVDLERVEAVAAKRGLVSAWFNDDTHRYFAGEDATLWISLLNGSLIVQIIGDVTLKWQVELALGMIDPPKYGQW